MQQCVPALEFIIIIHKGKIIAEGTLDELISKHGDESVLRIKNCKSENIINILKEKDFNAFTEGNGDIAIKIEYKEQILEILSVLKYECDDYGTIDIRRSNLEEIFLKLTGAKLREAG